MVEVLACVIIAPPESMGSSCPFLRRDPPEVTRKVLRFRLPPDPPVLENGAVPEALPSDSHEPRTFATTEWSMVLLASKEGSPQAAEALERLCRTYWYPLYAFVRRKGRDGAEAEDLTQAFFAHLLARRDWLERVDPRKGRFRSYLLVALERFLVDEWKRANRQVRGGGAPVLSLERETAEARYRLEPVDTLTAEKLYRRRWAITLLDEALAALERERGAGERSPVFERLKAYLLGEKSAPGYAVTA